MIWGEQVALSSADLVSILEKYVVHWMRGDAPDCRCFHPPGAQSKVSFDVPMKRERLALVRAQVNALEFRRNHGLMSSGRDVLQQTFSSSDAHAVANSITKKFAWFYASDCTRMQETLIKLDTQRTGRISLAKFYAASPFFAEPEDYFRTQGVLDYSSGDHSKLLAGMLSTTYAVRTIVSGCGESWRLLSVLPQRRWITDCKIDSPRTGRIPLTKFYASPFFCGIRPRIFHTDWRRHSFPGENQSGYQKCRNSSDSAH